MPDVTIRLDGEAEDVQQRLMARFGVVAMQGIALHAVLTGARQLLVGMRSQLAQLRADQESMTLALERRGDVPVGLKPGIGPTTDTGLHAVREQEERMGVLVAAIDTFLEKFTVTQVDGPIPPP